MIKISKKTQCCGCTACFNACPKSAIAMKEDEEGFLYPKVDLESCVKCGRCVAVCPIKNKREKQAEETKGYILRNKDLNIVEQSTSGGAFTLFAEHLLKHGYIVYGAGYDVHMKVVHKEASIICDLEEMRGSKFVQSYLGDTFRKIRTELMGDRKVLFTGTPCQVEGLISYLGNKPENLVCIDFVCRGVPSPGLWKNYVDMMESKYESKVTGARFKHKTYGYHATTMKIDFENGKTWYGSGRVDPMMKAFVNELASRPSCHECNFKGISRISDVTMFDCYGFSQITGKKDDEKGWSSLLVHTDKGNELVESVRDNAIVYPVDVSTLIKNNGIMANNSALENPQRDRFYSLAESMSIDNAMSIISPITRKDHLIEKLKGIVYRTGLIKFAKRMKKESIHVKNRDV